jgi:threonylcarbamoyladenosine tRNA methylthiotransferase MtaB
VTEIVTFGCRLNAYESEVIRAHAATLDDTIVVNTCAVTAEAERQARQAIRRLHRERPAASIVVTGCSAQIDPGRWAQLPGVSRVLGNAEKLRAENWTPDAASAVADIMTARETAAHLVTEFGGRARAFLQVQQGCDHRCTFCVIPFGRGPNRSVPIGVIVEQARTLVQSGFREIVLTGVDIASYGAGLPGHPTLGQMVRRLLAAVSELPRVRLSSIDPAAIDEDVWRLIEHEKRLMPHLHLSVQAGADLILKRMRRRHLRADVLRIADRARALRPDIALGADLIAGFPTEDEAMFRNSLDLVAECGIAFLHVFPYSPRPGTPAARMPAVAPNIVRERAARLREAGAAALAAELQSRVGTVGEVLIEKPGLGRAGFYAAVECPVDLPPGDIVELRFSSISDGKLTGAPGR